MNTGAGRGTPRHPYLRHPEWHAERDDRPIAFAHRGGTDAAPENTLAAFEHAVGLGYRYLETDVHLTRDGVLVAFHDDDLGRTAGVEARLDELSAAEIAEVRIDGSHHVPTMTELFERFPTAHFNIDAKTEATVEPLCDLVGRMDLVDRVCLASFSQRRIDRMRRLVGPGLMTNLGLTSVAALRLLGRSADRGHEVAQVPPAQGPLTVVNESLLRRAAAHGLPVHVWTINDAATMRRLLDLGVDGIMTDETELLRDVFLERSLWPWIERVVGPEP